MGFVTRVLVTALAVFIADFLLEGVRINDDAKTVLIVAIVLALLNSVVKPILVLLTIPVTLVTLGLFLLVINALMVKWAAALVDGFTIDGWWTALLFSLIVSLVSYILHRIARRPEE